MEQLKIELLKKDREIEEYKKLVGQLQTRVEKFQTTMNELSNRLLQCERIVSFGKEENLTKSTQKTCTHEWVISYNELLGHEIKFSDIFYTVSTTLCFELSAGMENDKLMINLHRCRGVNDNEMGKIKSLMCGFMFTIYVIGRNGKLKVEEGNFDYEDLDFNVGANYQRSLGNGWRDFLDGERILDWLIKGQLHIFCRIDLRK